MFVCVCVCVCVCERYKARVRFCMLTPLCADSHLILDVDDMVHNIIDDCAQLGEKVNEESREESQLERRMGGGLRVESGVIESEECRDEGDEEGDLGVESGGMENQEGREEGHEE